MPMIQRQALSLYQTIHKIILPYLYNVMSTIRFFLILVVSICLSSTVCVQADTRSADTTTTKQVEELATDRPDQTESSTVVPQGALQVETGIVFERERGDNTRMSHIEHTALGTTLVRYGLLPSLELRFIGEFHRQRNVYFNEGDVVNEGLAESAVGVKIQICREEGIIPETALNLHMRLPVGGEAFSVKTPVPDFRFLCSHTLTEQLSLGYNLGAEFNGEEPSAEFVYTCTIGYALTEQIETYIEAFGSKPCNETLTCTIDGGISYLLTPLVKIDASAGVGLTAGAPSYYLSTGLSFRLFK